MFVAVFKMHMMMITKNHGRRWPAIYWLKPMLSVLVLQRNDQKKKSLSDDDDIRADNETMNPTSALFARALVNEVSGGPNKMTPAAMAEREKRLMKAQQAAARQQQQQNNKTTTTTSSKPVGAMGKPNLLGSLAHSIGIEDVPTTTEKSSSRVVPPSSLQENRAQLKDNKFH